MEVKAHIRAVDDVSQTADKPMFQVSIETDKPLQIIQFRCFGNDVSNGNVEKLRQTLGKVIMLPIEADLYKGNLQYKIPFGEQIEIAKPVQKAS